MALSYAMAQLKAELSADQMASIVNATFDKHRHQHPQHIITTAALGDLSGLIKGIKEAGSKPAINIHSAEAARLAQLGAHGAAALLGHKGYAELHRTNREAARDARDSAERGERSSGSGTSNSSRYDNMGSVDWGSSKGQAMTRAYAVSNDMSWATKQDGLMRMGKPALQALHEVHLQEDGYKALRDPSGLAHPIHEAFGATVF